MKIVISLLNKFKVLIARYFPRFYAFLLRYKKIIKFLVAGAMTGGMDLLVLYLLHGLGHMEIVRATSLAFIFSLWLSFRLQKVWTFSNHSQEDFYKQMFLYLGVIFINLNLNAWAMHLLVNRYQVWYLLAQLIVSAFIGLESFLVYRFIIFRQNYKK